MRIRMILALVSWTNAKLPLMTQSGNTQIVHATPACTVITKARVAETIVDKMIDTLVDWSLTPRILQRVDLDNLARGKQCLSGRVSGNQGVAAQRLRNKDGPSIVVTKRYVLRQGKGGCPVKINRRRKLPSLHGLVGICAWKLSLLRTACAQPVEELERFKKANLIKECVDPAREILTVCLQEELSETNASSCAISRLADLYKMRTGEKTPVKISDLLKSIRGLSLRSGSVHCESLRTLEKFQQGIRGAIAIRKLYLLWAIVAYKLLLAWSVHGYFDLEVTVGAVSLAIVQCVTVLLFALDRGYARCGFWRMTENTLCATALCGGWPAGWMSILAFRHKSAKKSFQEKYAAATGYNLFLLGAIYVCIHIAPLLDEKG